MACSHSEFMGIFIRGLPILRPFKIHYHDPRKQNEDNDLNVGVFMILPQESLDDTQVIDLTINVEACTNLDHKELPSIPISMMVPQNIKTENQQDTVEVKKEPTTDYENNETDINVLHNYSIKVLVGVKRDIELIKSINMTESSTSSEPTVEIENVDSDDNLNLLNKRFKRVSDDDIGNIGQMDQTQGVSKSSRQQTEAELRLFNTYLKNVGEKMAMEMETVETSTSSEPKVEIENVERAENPNILIKRVLRVSKDDRYHKRQMNRADSVSQLTKQKTGADLKRFNTYLDNVGEKMAMEMMPPDQLNEHICGFILSVTRKDGNEYEPISIRSLVSSIDWHLRTKGYKYSILNSVEFEKTRWALKTKQNHLQSHYKGISSKDAEPLDDETIAQFYECGTLGDRSPESLFHSLWLICAVQFGIKPGQAMYDMKWGDVQLKEDETGQYLEYDSEITRKRRIRTLDTRLSDTRPRAYATSDPQRDPVHLYTTYKNQRPEGTLNPESSFFLTISHHDPFLHKKWYIKQRMGLNRMYGVMSKMKNAANLAQDRRIGSASARKRAIQLWKDGSAPSHIHRKMPCTVEKE
ncbi:uncharacterized protein LOC127873760 isoform X3 [Dreissena polymorpha]|uniref:uncharacterized protein LOC127873760 isoform X3 n=1 Tax=Dreissena polymorpha TaxID=45954 RepID=UPI002264BAED|nr:uncharacterized protein LOC127873760 isoform X3 [Dreissena polymorpha]